MDEIRIEKLARAMALADSREMILATSDASELHHVSDSGWKDYRHMAIAALAEDAALSPPEPTEGQIEAAARGVAAITDPGKLWSEISVNWQEHHRILARAALRAMPLQDHAAVDVNSREAALWSENMRLRSALEQAVAYADVVAMAEGMPAGKQAIRLTATDVGHATVVFDVKAARAMVAEQREVK